MRRRKERNSRAKREEATRLDLGRGVELGEGEEGLGVGVRGKAGAAGGADGEVEVHAVAAKPVAGLGADRGIKEGRRGRVASAAGDPRGKVEVRTHHA